MQFGEQTSDIRNTFKRAISDLGYTISIIDEKEHNNQIVPEIIFEKLIKKLPDNRERKNGKNGEKNRLNAYLPPSFLKNRTFFIKENKAANRVNEKACAHTDNVSIHAEKLRKNQNAKQGHRRADEII